MLKQRWPTSRKVIAGGALLDEQTMLRNCQSKVLGSSSLKTKRVWDKPRLFFCVKI